MNWEETLSLGETQRLAMARLFYHAPTYAILDECTSAVSTAMEERLYDLCRQRNITCITIRWVSLVVIGCQAPARYFSVISSFYSYVSHRPALVAFHDAKLELDGAGSYTLTSVVASRCVYSFFLSWS